MEATAAAPVALVPETAPNGLLGRLAALPAAAKMKLGVASALLVAAVVATAMWANQGDWRVLYSGLPDKDAGAIVSELGTMGVPYRYSEGGGAIQVPAERLYDVKMKLAAKGMPKASVVGNELLDVSRFGQTDRQERVNMQRALEGELVRTIIKVDGVQDARVHLALPNQNGFFREQQKPSASVMLTLHPGRMLDRAQVAGIVHLVSSSVAEMSPKSVSVLDQRGALLSQQDEDPNKLLNEQQLQYVAQVEKGYLDRVTALLEPVVGRDNLRATVTADVDFTQVESTSEQFRPNQGDQPAAVRSQMTSEANAPGTAQPSGVPGAATNQPPVPATAPVNGASAPLQTAQAGQVGGGGRREATTNYEVDRTVQMKRNAVGVVRRLNAAVVVNHRSQTNDKGKTTTTPLSAEELDKLTALVQEAVGYNKERGDSVRVINAPFKAPGEDKPDDLPLWQQPWLLDLVRAGAVPAALALVALGLIFGVIKPALKPAVVLEPADKRGNQLDAVVDDDAALPGPDGARLPALEPPRENHKLEQARQLARDNPAAVANIMREWVSGEAAA